MENEGKAIEPSSQVEGESSFGCAWRRHCEDTGQTYTADEQALFKAGFDAKNGYDREAMEIIHEAARLIKDTPTGSGCEDCNRAYGEPGFPDFIIPFDTWRQISTNGDDSGLLCPSCICARLEKAGLRCEGAFVSGPINSVSYVEMMNLRRVENIELAIDGRDNRWKGIRGMVNL
jgi:hypothetical protein